MKKTKTRDKNRNLRKAKQAKFDEYYTQLYDVENELKHYLPFFKDKVIYCNCDDPQESAFFHYFARQSDLGYKRLIATCYKSQNADLFTRYDSNRGLCQEFTGTKNQNLIPDNEEIGVEKLEGDGDFRSDECVEFLKQADVVVTNPPFSLFREYIAQLMEYKKKFIIVGNKNAIHYRDIFPLFQKNQIWIGYTSMSRDLLFDVSKEYAEELVETKRQGSAYKIVDGKVKARSTAIWFTNLPHKKRNEELTLTKTYSAKKHPKFDNLDAINVDKTVEIPKDHFGVMGVPISFLDKYNPNQFKIVGFRKGADGKDLKVGGNYKYMRILIQRV